MRESDAFEIVLVEDDDGDALLVREYLSEGLGASVLTRARSFQEALRVVRPTTSCVLLDLGLPDSSGLDNVRTLLGVHPHVAVIVLTGADSAVTGIDAVAHGAQDYLVKSRVDEDSLARSIRYAVERRDAQAAADLLVESERRRTENARMERALLPEPVLHSDRLDLWVRYRASRDGAQLGGDFYDAVELDNGSLVMLIGDVSGHGPDEAALGARLRSAWRALVLAHLDPLEVLTVLDKAIRTERHEDTVFATACMVLIGRGHSSAFVVLAGHPPPLLLLPDREPMAMADGAWGPLLGITEDPSWTPVEVALPEGWEILLYTDGLFEGRAAPDRTDRLGELEMRSIIGQLGRDGFAGEELLDRLLTEVEDRNGETMADDIALYLVCGGSGCDDAT